MVAAPIATAPLKQEALNLGFDLCGVCPAVAPPHYEAYEHWLSKGYHGTMGYLQRNAPLKQHPENLLPGAKSIIAAALNYNQPNPERPDHPRIARYALGRDYHKVLRSKLKRLETYLTQQYPESRHRACVDSAPILERDYAQLAGLGWYGKNTMLINSHRGSWFFIGLLITTLDIEPDKPATGQCGTCTKCLDACPTGALMLEDGRWQLDARRCISYLTIEHEGELDYDTAGWTFGCDICQEVCPFNEPRPSQPLRGAPTNEADFLDRRELPPLRELANVTFEDWDRLTRGSALRRTGHAGLKRNAQLAAKDI
jgi:epoxyqueuosine reductase